VTYASKTGYVLTSFLVEAEAPVPVEDPFVSGYAEVNTGQGTLNMRSRARDNSEVIARLPNTVYVRMVEFGERWSKVAYGSRTGFVLTEYLIEVDPADLEPEEEFPEDDVGGDLGPYAFARVNTGGKGTLNMRRHARDGAAVVGRLGHNALVQVLQRGPKWSRVTTGSKTGFVMTLYIVMLSELPYENLTPGGRGPEVRTLKERLQALGYLTRRQVNDRYCSDTEQAIRKMELINGLPETGLATPELQAFLYHGRVERSKSGYGSSNTDRDSGLTVTLFAWTSGYIPLGGEDRGSVEVLVHYVANASGGTGPYNITVRRTAGGDRVSGDSERNPFRIRWNPDSPTLYLAATVTDEDGNTVSTRVRVGILNVLPDPDAID